MNTATASSALPRTASPSTYHKAQYQLAVALMNIGSVLTKDSNHPLVVKRFIRAMGEERGFKLKLHERNPESPLSPFYLNLRTPDNPKPGPLTQDIVDQSATCIQMLVLANGLTFDAVAGVPNAGDPFAAALARFTGKPLIYLKKEEEGGKRRVTSVCGLVSESVKKVLLVDDLITGADSKREAIGVLREAKLQVTDVVVLVDREQGGLDGLMASGCELYSVFTITKLLDLYVELGTLGVGLSFEIQKYLASQV